MSSLLSWLHSFGISRTTRTARRRCFSHRPARPRCVRPRLEALEDRLTPSGPTLNVLADFNGTNGALPEAGLIMDSSGNLYGTTAAGGASSGGTIFEWVKSSGSITTLASFPGGVNGAGPWGGLIMDGSGNLYGTTQGGGASNDGTIFEWVKSSGTLNTLASFNGGNGTGPLSSLVMDSSGNLYGTTPRGGTSDWGTLFEWVKSSGTLTTLVNFNGSNGAEPLGGLLMDGSGNLYGTTAGGGASNNGGTIFEWVKSSGSITTLAAFDGNGVSTGAVPSPDLVMDSSGNLYGTTQGNDYNVFEWVKSSGTLTKLAWFNSTSGYPEGGDGLVMDSSGNLYGSSPNGPFGGDVFEYVKNSGATAGLVWFNTGDAPKGDLIMDGSGNLYGVTSQGGPNSDGYVYEVQGIDSQTTDQWTGADGAVNTNWSDGANWSTGAPPTDSQVALFTNNSSVKSFTATVDNSFNTGIAGLVIDSSWGGTINVPSSLTINGNFTMASGTLDIGSAVFPDVFIAGPASQWTGGTINIGASSGFQNSGVFTMDTNGRNLVLTGGGTFFNRGNEAGDTIVETGTNSLELENGATLQNEGTFDLTDNGNISQSNGGTFLNHGTLEKTGGTSASTVSSSFVNESDASATGAITVQTGTLILASAGGTSTGGTINVAKNATLDLTGGNTVAYTGAYTGTGAGTVALKSGTLQVGSGGATFNMAGSLFKWTGGTIDVTAGNFTNSNTITYSSGNVAVNGAGSLINQKTINQTSTGTLTLENGATLNNAKGSTYNIESNGGISQSGGGAITNAGTLEKTKGTGTTTIASATLSNTGTVKESIGTLDIAATVSQISGSTLTAGTWDVTGSPTVSATLDITSAGSLTTIGTAAHVTLSGLNTTFGNLSGLNTIAKGGSFTLAGGQSFTTTGALSNNGSLTLGPGSILTVGGNFTQSSTGSLAIQLGGSNSAPTFGQLLSTTGSVALAGKLSVTSTVVPAVGSSFNVLDNEGNAAISGTFANLPEGTSFTVKKGTTAMTFKISYVGSDDDGGNNVVITRVS